MKRILIVDDEKGAAEALKDKMESHAFHIDVADSLNQVLSLLNANMYDMVFTSLSLLVSGSGFEVLRASRRRDPSTPVILMSGKGATEFLAKASLFGFDDSLEKPVTPETIIEKTRVHTG